jgi:hypothetical protein
MSKPPLIPSILAVIVGLFAAVALVDKLGRYRWFAPYDQDVYSAALFIIVLEMVFVIPKLRLWFAEYQTKLDSEDGDAP